MPRMGFYSENAGRSYPFVPDYGIDPRLPDSAIVDFGCTIGMPTHFRPSAAEPNIFFDEGFDTVYLYRISRTSNTIYFEFRFNSLFMGKFRLRFSRNIADPENTVQYVRGSYIDPDDPETFPPYKPHCGFGTVGLPILAVEGYLVTGDLTALIEMLGDTNPITIEEGLTVEPALVEAVEDTFVRSLVTANVTRPSASPTEECASSLSLIIGEYEAKVGSLSSCLQGDLQLFEGYNCNLAFSPEDNSITISAQADGGSGRQCEEFDTDLIGLPEDTYDGPLCQDLLRSVNGISSRVLRLSGGPGVTVREVEGNPHKLIVNVNLADIAGCQAGEDD